MGVLDDVAAVGRGRPRDLAEVAAFYEVHPWVVTSTVRRHVEEFRADGWCPQRESATQEDVWTDRAVVRAGLLIPSSVVAAHLRHLLDMGEMPLIYSTSSLRLQQCRRLYEKALGVVAHVHESSPDDLWRTMQTTDRYELMSMVVALAAVTPPDRPNPGQWLQRLGRTSSKDGSISRGLAMIIPQRERADERQLPKAGSAAIGVGCQDAVAQ